MRQKRDLKIGIRISHAEREALAWLSAERDMPMSLIIRQMLRQAAQEAGMVAVQGR